MIQHHVTPAQVRALIPIFAKSREVGGVLVWDVPRWLNVMLRVAKSRQYRKFYSGVSL